MRPSGPFIGRSSSGDDEITSLTVQVPDNLFAEFWAQRRPLEKQTGAQVKDERRTTRGEPSLTPRPGIQLEYCRYYRTVSFTAARKAAEYAKDLTETWIERQDEDEVEVLMPSIRDKITFEHGLKREVEQKANVRTRVVTNEKKVIARIRGKKAEVQEGLKRLTAWLRADRAGRGSGGGGRDLTRK